MFKERFIGDKEFYKTSLKIVLPIMIQWVFTNLVTLINNIIVGGLGTEQLAGVSIANQFINIYYLCSYGIMSGAEIIGTQLYGKKDYDNLQNVYKFKMYATLILFAAASLLFVIFGNTLVTAFIHESNDGMDIVLTKSEAMIYLLWMIPSLLPNSLSSMYSSTLRETQEVMVPLKASVVGIIISVITNLIFIPIMGVRGAAISMLISRVVEFLINFIWAHRHTERLPHIRGAFRNLKIRGDIIKPLLKTSFPMIMNETMWEIGVVMVNQQYSIKGVLAVAVINMAATLSALVNAALSSMGQGVGLIVGNLLGNGEFKKARETMRKLYFMAICLGIVLAIILMAISPLYPMMYGETGETAHLVTVLVWCEALASVIGAFTLNAYYILRAGGKTLLVALFDAGAVWGLNLVTAFILSRFTSLSIEYIYLCVKLSDLIKAAVGIMLIKSDVWVNKIEITE